LQACAELKKGISASGNPGTLIGSPQKQQYAIFSIGRGKPARTFTSVHQPE